MEYRTNKKEQPIDKIIRPFQEFAQAEASGGILLIIAVILALLMANSPFKNLYFETWSTNLTISFGNLFYLSKPTILWINDGIMTFFFLLVGLEIKRELLVGELSSPKKALLPAVAAIGGMTFPALIFILFNLNTQWTNAWAVPMATDIAFTLGILAILGSRVPSSLKLFLASFAIVDDIGAVLIIALFYTEKIALDYLLVSALLLLLLVLYNFLGGKKVLFYLVIGVLIWFFMVKSGIHATIAGILLAFTIPATKGIDVSDLKTQAKEFLESLAFKDSNIHLEEEIHHSAMKQLEEICKESETPLQRLEHSLNPWVSFLIIPIFAFANAGVDLSILGSQISYTDLVFHPIFLGILLGLVIGNPIGVNLLIYLAYKLKLISLPRQSTWVHIIGISSLAGVGFTMSHFIASLAFAGDTNVLALNIARFVILIGSLISGLIGFSILYYSKKINDRLGLQTT